MKNLHKLILLSGLSSCFVSVSQANEPDLDDVYLKTPDFYRDVACGAAPRYIDFWLKNETDDVLEVVEMDLTPLMGNTLNIVSIAPATSDEDSCGYGVPNGEPFMVAPDDSCKIVLAVDPGVEDVTQDCYVTIPHTKDSSTSVLTGHVAQELEIFFRNYQGSISTMIDFDMTYLGSTNSFSLIGDNICNGGPCGFIPQSSLDGTIQVSQDVAVTGEGCAEDGATCLTEDIELNGNHAFIDDSVSEAAESDLGNGFWNLFNLSRSPYHKCDLTYDTTTDSSNLADYTFSSDDGSFGTLVVCFSGGADNAGASMSVDGPIGFQDNVGGTHYIIILDFPATGDNPYDDALSINSGADFDMDAGDYTVDPENIFWVINGNINVGVEGAFAGNLATVGYVSSDDTTPGSQTLFLGRLLSYDNDLFLRGNTIDCPNCD